MRIEIQSKNLKYTDQIDNLDNIQLFYANPNTEGLSNNNWDNQDIPVDISHKKDIYTNSSNTYPPQDIKMAFIQYGDNQPGLFSL